MDLPRKDNAGRLTAAFCFCLVIAFFAGCRPSPEEAVVVGKGDGRLEQKILEQSASPKPTDIPKNGERVTRAFTSASGNVEVRVDALVGLDEGLTFPAVAVKPMRFTQEQADAIVGALTVGAQFYDVGQSITKDQWDEEILEHQNKLSEAKDKKLKEIYKEAIEDFLKEREKAPATEKDRKDANRKFSKETAGGAGLSEGIAGKFDRNGKTFSLFIKNSEDGKQSSAECFMVGGSEWETVGRAEPGTNYDTALKQAQDLLDKTGADLTLADAFILKSAGEGSYGYEFMFTREVNGLHMVYEGTDTAADVYNEDQPKPELYQEPWPYERIMARITENGFAGFFWQGPCKVEKTLNPDVHIQSFEKTLAQFEKMIFAKNGTWEDFVEHGNASRIKVSVDRITLGLMRVQSGNAYYLIPVWDFYGKTDTIMEDGVSLLESKFKGAGEDAMEAAVFRDSLRSLITLNAIDGSVIDRMLGY